MVEGSNCVSSLQSPFVKLSVNGRLPSTIPGLLLARFGLARGALRRTRRACRKRILERIVAQWRSARHRLAGTHDETRYLYRERERVRQMNVRWRWRGHCWRRRGEISDAEGRFGSKVLVWPRGVILRLPATGSDFAPFLQHESPLFLVRSRLGMLCGI